MRVEAAGQLSARRCGGSPASLSCPCCSAFVPACSSHLNVRQMPENAENYFTFRRADGAATTDTTPGRQHQHQVDRVVRPTPCLCSPAPRFSSRSRACTICSHFSFPAAAPPTTSSPRECFPSTTRNFDRDKSPDNRRGMCLLLTCSPPFSRLRAGAVGRRRSLAEISCR